ncbi:MAG TPA: hypothetical protein VFL59_14475 [Candidatus Nanopelagicales bacterium]|nr:hypothetical protein [Candidatus Nanopelagicales bacterium]
MGKSEQRADIARIAQRVGALVEQGLDVAEAYAASTGGSTRASREHAKAMEKHQQKVRRHERRQVERRRDSVVLTAASGAAAVIGVVDIASGDGLIPLSGWMWLVAGAVCAVVSVRKRYDAQHATAPEPPALSAAVGVNDLRRDAIGWAEAQNLAAVRRQIGGIVPAVASLHPEAGRELKSADDEAAPALAAQVTRLAVLDQVRRDLPGSQAAQAATDAAQLVRARLAQGVAVYDRLLAAASTMLASPDLGRSSAEVLGPAADALTAYAEGLRTADTL